MLFVCDAAFEAQARGLMAHASIPIEIRVISAGKLRRYHGIPMWRQLVDAEILSKNTRDLGRILAGYKQSRQIIKQFKPDVVFAKGGYVCLPVGYAAKHLNVPLVIHDSDTRPGLTNKVLSRFAARIATGSPVEYYPYNKAITTYTGVPIDPSFHPFTSEERQQARTHLGVVDPARPLVVFTGGGLGSLSINRAAISIGESLVQAGYSVIHVAGKAHFHAIKEQVPNSSHYQLLEFVYSDMDQLLGAADVAISRGSATFLQELAALATPTIIVPAANLGDQVKNAEVYGKARAAVVLTDHQLKEDPQVLYGAIQALISASSKTKAMSKRFHAYARPHAAQDVATIIYEVGEKQ